MRPVIRYDRPGNGSGYTTKDVKAMLRDIVATKQMGAITFDEHEAAWLLGVIESNETPLFIPIVDAPSDTIITGRLIKNGTLLDALEAAAQERPLR